MAPLRIGSRPVSKAARLGAHDGEATKAWVKVMPARASRVMFGVRMSVPPYTEQSAQPRSSARMSKMFATRGFSPQLALLQKHIDEHAVPMVRMIVVNRCSNCRPYAPMTALAHGPPG